MFYTIACQTHIVLFKMQIHLKKEENDETALAESYFIKKWDNLYCELNAKEKKVNRKLSFVFAFLNLLKYSVYVLAIILAAVYLFDGSIDLGMFSLITGMLGTTHSTIEVIVSKSGDIAGSLRYAKDYYYFLNQSDDMVKSKNKFECGIGWKICAFHIQNPTETLFVILI